MNGNDPFEQFFQLTAFAVVGASKNREKYGNKVLRCYMQHGLEVYPVNERADKIERLTCIASINDLPDAVSSISIITPPRITEKTVQKAIAKGINNIWMQPGAESAQSVAHCQESGVNVIASGYCILVYLGFRGS